MKFMGLMFAVLMMVLAPKASFAQPPQPVGSGFQYSDVRALFDAGAPATSLEGTWTLIASTATELCRQGMADRTDLTGLANVDGSLQQIVFSYVQDPTLPRTPEGQVLSVTLLNLGGVQFTQGPYKVAATEPQFSQWAYSTGTGNMSNNAYYENACRTDAASNRLVCMRSFRLVDQTGEDQHTVDCATSDYGIGYIYEKWTN